MTKTLEAVFDGEVLRPDEPLEIDPNTRVRITLEVEGEEEEEKPKGEPYSSLLLAASLKLQGPSDFSERIEDYLHGGFLGDDK